MSAERQRDVQVDVELGENAARVTVTETREVAELFEANGDLVVENRIELPKGADPFGFQRMEWVAPPTAD